MRMSRVGAWFGRLIEMSRLKTLVFFQKSEDVSRAGPMFIPNIDTKQGPTAPRTRDILTLFGKSSVFTRDVLKKQL